MSNKNLFKSRMSIKGITAQELARHLHPHLTRSAGMRLLDRVKLLPNAAPINLDLFFHSGTREGLPLTAMLHQMTCTGGHPKKAWCAVIEYALYGLKLLREEAKQRKNNKSKENQKQGLAKVM